jgi:hypothetical protein
MSIELENIRGIPLIYSVKLKRSAQVAENLAGAAITLKVRPTIDSTNVLVECTLLNGRIQIVDAIGGEFLINIEKEITNTLPAQSSFDILVVNSSGEYFLLAKDGKIKSRNFVSR